MSVHIENATLAAQYAIDWLTIVEALTSKDAGNCSFARVPQRNLRESLSRKQGLKEGQGVLDRYACSIAQ